MSPSSPISKLFTLAPFSRRSGHSLAKWQVDFMAHNTFKLALEIYPKRFTNATFTTGQNIIFSSTWAV
jgi:hypothetical protein